MYTISILSQKGGSGKTTLALNLAGAVEAAGQVPVVVDVDQQGSCKLWSDRRGRPTPVVISAQAVAIDEVIKRASENGADYLIIDTAPQSETTALQACRVADLTLIPCRPSFVDLKAVSVTVDLVRLVRRPALFVLSCVRPRDRTLPDGAEDYLRQYGLEVAEQRITHRAAFVHSLIRGETVQEFDPECVAALESGHSSTSSRNAWARRAPNSASCASCPDVSKALFEVVDHGYRIIARRCAEAARPGCVREARSPRGQA